MNTLHSSIAENHWETRWSSAYGASDPAYERTNVALRRWIDGMEQALIAKASRRTSFSPTLR